MPAHSLATPVLAVAAPRMIVEDQRLRSIKRRFVLGLNFVSLAGCAVAAQRALERGLGVLEITLFLAMYSVTAIGITVGYHRHFAHRSFDTSQIGRALLAIAGSMAGHGPVISWTATHRCHHKFADVAGDPHSPRLHGTHLAGRMRGLWHAHMGWLLAGHLPNSMVFAKDLCRDSLAVRMNRLYLVWVGLGVAIPALLGAILSHSLDGAVQGLLWGGLVRLFVSFHATCSINSVAHSIGRRAFATPDGSTNVAWLAWPTFGEGWHNNHHAFPASARLGLRWWQLDPGYAAIVALERLGLVRNVKRAQASSWARPGGAARGATAMPAAGRQP